MAVEIKLNEDGLEKYPTASIILENVMMGLWIALGTIACWFFNPLIAGIYLSAAIIIIIFVLRKILCTKCYYYDKWCHTGWGKLSSLFFKKGNTEKFSNCKGIKLAPVFYGFLLMGPLILIIISMILEFSFDKLIIAIVLFLISFYSGGPSRKKGCKSCKMKLICPGCAVKDKNSN